VESVSSKSKILVTVIKPSVKGIWGSCRSRYCGFSALLVWLDYLKNHQRYTSIMCTQGHSQQ